MRRVDRCTTASRCRLLALLCGALTAFSLSSIRAADPLPAEPIEIGATPQFLFDQYIVDNHWALKITRESFSRVLHAPRKFEGNPLFTGSVGYPTVVKDDNSPGFRMCYQVSGFPQSRDYSIAYAESPDGVKWNFPRLGLHTWQGSKQNNVVVSDGGRANGPWLLDVPPEARRGYRYALLYNSRKGLSLVGSQDGIHWDDANGVVIAKMHSDTQNNIVYDAGRKEFVLYCRAKHLYLVHGKGNVVDTGESRRIARMSSPEPWTQWRSEPQTILVPDEGDIGHGFHRYYGMPVKLYGGIYWGMLWPLRRNEDIHTELAVSRDGFRYDRLAGLPQLVSLGAEGTWDDGMVFGAGWVEVGDEWWIYYGGADGPHGSRERSHGIGLAKIRKEGFISMRGPDNGGVIVTRQLVWPGGDLLLNADARGGEIRVRVSDARRQPHSGFDYDDCSPLASSGVSQRVAWKDKSLHGLAGQVVRLEFLVTKADLFAFRATGNK